MRQEPDIHSDPDRIEDEADRASREIKSQVARARRRLLRKYRDILRERPSWKDADR